MASGGSGNHPWDRDSPDGKVLYRNKYRNVLNKQRPTLITVDIKPMFDHLLHLGVIDSLTRERIELNATTADMNARLIDHIERGPCNRLHGYLRACVLTTQEHIVELLGFDPRKYRLPTDVRQNTSTVHLGRHAPATPGWRPPAPQHAGTVWGGQVAPPYQYYTGVPHDTSPVPVPVRPVPEPGPGDINARPGDVFDEAQRERLITDLSLGLGEGWYRCGILLGLDPATLDNIKSGESPTDLALKMLIKWKQQNGNLNDAELKDRLCRSLQDAGLSVQVPFVTNSQESIDVIFARLSGHLGTQWRNLAFELGIHRSDIQVMTAQTVRSHKDCAEDMLVRWSQGQHRDDVVKLKTALWCIERRDLMKHIERYIVQR